MPDAMGDGNAKERAMSDVTSIASQIIQVGTVCQKDTTPPPKPTVDWAGYGDLNHDSGARRDPLALYLGSIEPGCRVEFINLSVKPDATWEADAKGFGGNTKRCLHDGKYGLMYSNAEAKKLGIEPGDILWIRQVDDAGNVSEPAELAMRQVNSNWIQLDGRARDQFGVDVPAGRFYLGAYTDNRKPTAVPQNMRIEGTEVGKGQLTCNRGVEPYCTVTIRNERTLKDFAAKADGGGRFTLAFEADVGDPLHVTAFDHNSNTADLGLITYAPSCVKAGPLAQNQLQDQAKQG
jgi:hypothetical protein